MKLTQDYLNSIFTYDPDTGHLHWRHDGKNVEAGQRAGYPFKQSDGSCYVRVGLFRKKRLAHRLICTMVYGDITGRQVDHINGNGTDNRLCNLRLVAHRENSRNRPINKNNTSGVCGVSFSGGRYTVSINSEYLMSTKDFFEAVCARKSAERAIGYHENHGTRPRFSLGD